MATEHSFDISAKINKQEFKNALEQAKKEVLSRYDFKSDKVKEIDFNEKDNIISINADSSNKADAIKDILFAKMIKRDIQAKALKETKRENASGGSMRVIFEIMDKIPQDIAKNITASIKKAKFKVQASIQGDEIRVKAKSIDELQNVMAHVKSMDLDVPLNFSNYK